MQGNLMSCPSSPNFTSTSSPSETEHQMILSLSPEELSDCISNYSTPLSVPRNVSLSYRPLQFGSHLQDQKLGIRISTIATQQG